MSDKLVNKGFNGWSQLGIFFGVIGAGLVFGSIAGILIWTLMTGEGLQQMQEDLMKPQFGSAIKMIQLVTTLFIFFLPAVAYAFIIFRNGWLALGFRRQFVWQIAGLAIVIILASMPFIDWLSAVNKSVPLPSLSRKYFDTLEKDYEDQVKVIGDVKTTGQYLLSLVIIALLPAFFEEVFFRGTLQNMLSRWKNNSYVYIFLAAVLLMAVRAIWWPQINGWWFNSILVVLVLLLVRSRNITDRIDIITNHRLFPVIATAILFSAVHASWYGFIPRFVLGMVLGLIFLQTNNIIYTIILHFFNNAAVVTVMFIAARQNKPVADAEEQGFPWWSAIISLLVLFLLFRLLARQKNLPPPEEIIMNRNYPFSNNFPENQES